MPADFGARFWIERETINHGEQSQYGNQNESNVKVRDGRSASWVFVQQRGESQRDSAGVERYRATRCHRADTNIPEHFS